MKLNTWVSLKEYDSIQKAIGDMNWDIEIEEHEVNDSMALITLTFESLEELFNLGLLAGKFSQHKDRIN